MKRTYMTPQVEVITVKTECLLTEVSGLEGVHKTEDPVPSEFAKENDNSSLWDFDE